MQLNLQIPIKTETKGGYTAEILSVHTDSEDCVHGIIYFQNGNMDTGMWSLTGICRDSSQECNLDWRSPELNELLEFIQNGLTY